MTQYDDYLIFLHHAQLNPFMWCFNVSLYSSIFFIQLQIKIIARLFQMHLVSCPQASGEVHFVYRTEIYEHMRLHIEREKKTIKVLYFFLLLPFQLWECVSFPPSLPPPRDLMTRDRSN